MLLVVESYLMKYVNVSIEIKSRNRFETECSCLLSFLYVISMKESSPLFHLLICSLFLFKLCLISNGQIA